ncbi:MAG: ABC transporter permease [Chloroflexi bacterium]|nr:ABC transporter permease [Chloroflexota bacterium]
MTQIEEFQENPEPSESLTSLAVRALLRHRSGMIGLIITLIIIILTLLAPRLAPYNELEMHAEDRFHPPSETYFFGTDEFGRDIYSRVLIGARNSLGVGVISIAIAAIVGVPIGLVAGYESGWFDTLMMRFFDALLAFPAILLAIVTLAVLGPGAFTAMLAIAIVNIPAFARLTRANVLAEKEKEYIEAARALGAKPTRIIFSEILPNVLATLLVQVTVSIAGAILLESALSFLGLGTPLPAPSWGSMLSIGRGYMPFAPWYSIFPGLAITLLVMGLYLLGDGLRDVLDPRRQKLV